MRRQVGLWPRKYASSQLKHSLSRRRSSCSSLDRRRPGYRSRAVGAAFAGGAGSASSGGACGAANGRCCVGAAGGARCADLAGAAASLSSSINSTCRARLISAASVSGLWSRTAWLRGGSRPPVNSWTHWDSSSRPARKRRLWKRLEYSSTVSVRWHSVSSKRGAERNAGPNHRSRRSLNRPHDGMPSSS
jgi:hypothetical protein